MQEFWTLPDYKKLDTPPPRTYLTVLDHCCAPPAGAYSNLSRIASQMRRMDNIQRFDLTDLRVGAGGVGMFASFLFGRRVPALTSDRREADT